ncbi:glutamate--cysteine ligase [Comamonas sp. BIGb0152]|uniref:glutamate--cysteine ligase n=1 Tax=Comamonas sp. BIGb0152 TaxID=2940601 RepID=UPI00216A6F1C|nr:glutamate--cysteine ligase [Comamonas sp. BIGb0152]MCS4295633.1 glutamate--cysteine ligase [Comamonas sp. BIGb0152]
MNHIQQRIDAIGAQRLLQMGRGIEKEGLRVTDEGALALTPHPAALGSALTHSSITTDFSESQIEIITGVHQGVQACLDELAEVHQYVYQVLQANDERLWISSMPCSLPSDENIPLGRFGTSHIGRSKSIYRMGLGHRYGRRMQTISGIHYNWSLPGVSSEAYFGLIRNFRRQAFLLLYLFGASPVLCPCFVQGRPHQLQPLGDGQGALHLPHATSLRMGRLGYQSDAQASISVSYNDLKGYADSLYGALTQPYPAYEKVGILNPGGEYNQLGTSLLQIENEFYGTIRPKRTVQRGERPLHALRERGVEYVEVRLMDINPFDSMGISASTMRLLDVFLLHCLLSDSPPDSPAEIAEMKHNQHMVAERGREPGLNLQRQGKEVRLTEWAQEILQACQPIAAALDQAHGTQDYSQALAQSQALLANPAQTPSAQVLAVVSEQFGTSFKAFGAAQSQWARAQTLARPWNDALTAKYQELAAKSIQAQKDMEAADTVPFEEWRQCYMSPEHLVVS